MVSLSYLLGSNSKKTSWLMDLARRDDFMGALADNLESFGYDIHYPFWGRSGAYESFSLLAEGQPEEFADNLKAAYRSGKLKAELHFSPRHGRAMNAHNFLHELVHFHQDRHGLYFMPLLRPRQFPVMLDARSTLGVILINEAMAETEAICASWRLKEKEYPEAWNGALLSPDWNGLARSYGRHRKGGLEEDEAERLIFEDWFKTSARRHYEHASLKMWERNVKRFLTLAKTTAPIHTHLRCLTPTDHIAQIIERLTKTPNEISPKTTAPPLYLHYVKSKERTSGGPISLSAFLAETAPVCPRAKKHLARLEQSYGRADNANIADIIQGAPAYIWKDLQSA